MTKGQPLNLHEHPRSESFLDLAELLDLVVREIKWPTYQVATSHRNALMGPMWVEREDRTVLPNQTARSLAAIAKENPAAAWLNEQSDFQSMRASMSRKAKRKGELFQDPRAEIWLTIAVAWGVFNWLSALESGQKPQLPRKQDWKDAVAAVKTLRSIENKGVTLCNAIQGIGPADLPFNWLDQIERALNDAATKAKKPQPDANQIERHAARAFARWCMAYFNEAPAVLVRKFGSLIGYESARLESQFLPLWRKQHLTRSIY